MKAIIVDIMHLPHINLFKNVIKKLVINGYKVDIICLDRGKNYSVLRKELPMCEIIKIGKHRGNMFSIIFEANILRFILLVIYLINKNYSLGLSADGFILGIALKIFRTPNIQFYDDPENKKNMFLQLLSADGLYYPPFKGLNKKIKSFNSLKEWAYLSPVYFTPDMKQIEKYNLISKRYIFVREVSVKTSNYYGQKKSLITNIIEKFPPDYKVILSLEAKDTRKYYPESWLCLEEPIEDIYSLIYFAKFLISSGDSMAREAAILGVPSIYCGIRKMAANNIMIEMEMLFHTPIFEIPTLMDIIIKNSAYENNQENFRKNLMNKWEDTTNFILDKIKEYIK
jgi:hypothetical protein